DRHDEEQAEEDDRAAADEADEQRQVVRPAGLVDGGRGGPCPGEMTAVRREAGAATRAAHLPPGRRAGPPGPGATPADNLPRRHGEVPPGELDEDWCPNVLRIPAGEGSHQRYSASEQAGDYFTRPSRFNSPILPVRSCATLARFRNNRAKHVSARPAWL